MRKIGGPKPERNKPGRYKPTMREDPQKIERVRERVQHARQERIATLEAKKDRTSLKKELEFVGNHREAYQRYVEAFFAKAEYPESRMFAEKITFPNYEKDKAQISPDEIKDIIARIPPHLVAKSSLVSIDFEWQDKLPVPAFDSDGNLDFEKIQIMTAEDFIKSHHHPHRALIGYTQLSSAVDESGKKTYASVIKPTTIPETISNDSELVRFYQIHVLIHEFLHTIEGPYRNEDAAKKWVLNKMSGRTFADWKTDYAKAVDEERIPGSYYASVYLDDLFRTSDQKPEPFGFPIREWICEDWVGAVLGIVPNSDGNTDFRTRALTAKEPPASLGRPATKYAGSDVPPGRTSKSRG